MATPFQNVGLSTGNRQVSPFAMSPAVPPTVGFDAQRQYDEQQYESDPISVLLGTAAESFVDSLTWGALKPDLVPQWEEDQHKWMTTVGKMAGNIGGFVTNIAATKGVLGAALKATKFGRGMATVSGIVQPITKAEHGIHGLFATGSSFAVYDVAREFVRQTQETDPDAFALGKAAAKGFFVGGIFGSIGEGMQYSGPVAQLISNASAMTVADAIAYKMDGERITPEMMAQSFLTGLAFTAISLPGLKGRQLEHRRQVTRMLDEHVKMLESNEPVGKMMQRVTGIQEKEFPKELLDFVETARNTLAKVQKTGGKSKVTKSQRGNIMKYRKMLDIPDAEFHEIAKAVSKGRTESSTGLTRTEARAASVHMERFLENYITVYGQEARTRLGMPEIKIEKFSGLTSFYPVDMKMMRLGLMDFVKDPVAASRMMSLEKSIATSAVNGYVDMWEAASKTGSIQKAKARIFNKPTNSMVELRDMLLKSGDDYKNSLRTLNAEQQEAVTGLRRIYDSYLDRTNAVRVASGQPPINKVEGYHRLMKMKEQPDVLPLESIGSSRVNERVGDIVNPTAMQRVGGGEEVNLGRNIITRPMLNAIHNDLMDIYLYNPTRIVKSELEALKLSGAISDAEHTYITRYMNQSIRGVREQSIKSADTGAAQLRDAFLDAGEGKLGKAYDKMLGFFGRERSDRPITDMINNMGAAIGRGMIAGRPLLAIRNTLQSFYALGMYDARHVGHAMLRNITGKLPAGYKSLVADSDVYLISKQQAFEGAKTAKPGIYGESHRFNVDTSGMAAYFSSLEKVVRGVDGWADAKGVAKRKTTPNFLTEGERNRIKAEVEMGIGSQQFIYHATGLPGVHTTTLGKAAFKLQTYPMNYVYKYLNEMAYRAVKGHPSWDKTGAAKLTKWERAGIFKHFVYSSILINAMLKAGYDYTQVAGVSIVPEDNANSDIGIGGVGLNFGVFNFRPSPGVSLLSGLVKMTGGNEYERQLGKREALGIFKAISIPNYLALKDVKRAYENGSAVGLFLRKTHTDKPRVTHGVIPKGYKPYAPFKPAWKLYDDASPKKKPKRPFGQWLWEEF